MGFFSWECRCCKKSILNTYGVGPGDKNAWMAQAVAVMPNDSVIRGPYDGYGRVGGLSLPEAEGFSFGDKEPDLYHQSCWLLAGKPLTYQGGSGHAGDQGWFYDDADYDLADPLPQAVAP